MAEPAPLQRTEIERLWRWERMMVRFYATATVVIVVSLALAVAYSEIAWVRRSLLGITLVLLGAATVLHFRERCPRCHARIKLTSGFMLPGKCRSCGVVFERPPVRA